MCLFMVLMCARHKCVHGFDVCKALMCLFMVLKRNLHSKALRKREKMHPARFSRPKSTFLTIPILIAGTNSVSSGNIVEESFFDKYFADKLKVPTII